MNSRTKDKVLYPVIALVGGTLSFVIPSVVEAHYPLLLDFKSWILLLLWAWTIVIFTDRLHCVRSEAREAYLGWSDRSLRLRKSFAELFSRTVLFSELHERLSYSAEKTREQHGKTLELQKQGKKTKTLAPEERRAFEWQLDDASRSFRLKHDEFYHLYDSAVQLNEVLRELGLDKFCVELGPRKYEAYLTDSVRS